MIQNIISMTFALSLIFFAVSMFSHVLPPRQGRIIHGSTSRYVRSISACLLVTIVMAISVVIDWSAPSPMASLQPLFAEFIPFTVVFLSCIAIVLFVYDTTFWNALFCAVAGYTVQNIWSGTNNLVLFASYHAHLWNPGNYLFPAIIALALFAVVYGAAYVLYARKITRDGFVLLVNKKLSVMGVTVIVISIAFSSIVKTLMYFDIPVIYSIMCQIVHIIMCVLVLFMEFSMMRGTKLEDDLRAVNRVLEGERKQYEISKENIKQLNIKAHDLKHQIHSLSNGKTEIDLSVLDEAKREVDLFDSTYRTQNEALDVVLTEKAIICKREDITLACMANGKSLGFMSQSDVYSLFGNLLDNAIEATRKVEDENSRIIGIDIRDKAGMLTIHIDNPYVGNIEFSDGLPLTTKDDHLYHGFGMMSVKTIVDRYNGNLTINAEDGTFNVNILI